MRSFTVLKGLTVLAVGLAIGGGAGSAVASASAPAPAACTGTVQITSFAFVPATVATGQSSAATLTAQNCTDQPLPASTTWTGRFMGSTAGIPAGCPAIDPLPRPASFPASGQISLSTSYLVFPNCTATSLQVTVRITGSDGTPLGQQTATLTINSRPACSVSYVRQNEWRGGFVAAVTVTNTAAVPVNGWSLTFDFPGDQRITNAWSAAVTQVGSTVTATNASYNGTIAPGGQVTFGFLGTWLTNDTSPAGGFVLNGASCAAG